MPEKTPIEKTVWATFEHDPVINLHRFPIQIEFVVAQGALILSGEVEHIVAKKRAFDLASRVDGVQGVMDRLRVAPSERRGDGAIRASITESLLQEPVLKNCTIRARNKGQLETLQEPTGTPACLVEFSVQDAVVTLHGRVGSLTHKRLAGVLAWWAPGSCDVINELQIVPPEIDTDDEIADALHVVLEKDPLMYHADDIGIHVRNGIVTLTGSVASPEEMKMAEIDAWYLTGVRGVVNQIVVRT
jgi:osmotically-inducible protein OsmY